MNGLRWPLPCILPERGDCCAFPKVLAHAGEDAQPLAGTSSLDLELRPQGLLSSRRPLSKGGYIRPWLAFKHIWRSAFSSGAPSAASDIAATIAWPPKIPFPPPWRMPLRFIAGFFRESVRSRALLLPATRRAAHLRFRSCSLSAPR